MCDVVDRRHAELRHGRRRQIVGDHDVIGSGRLRKGLTDLAD
jgi:hypothetical protein